MFDIAVKLREKSKIGGYVVLSKKNGAGVSGRVHSYEEDNIVLENIEGFWERSSNGTFRPQMSINKVYVAYDDVDYFVVQE